MYRFLFFLCFIPSFIIGETPLYPIYDYVPNPLLAPEVWNKVKPYLLPSNHPVKKKLDRLFRHTSVLTSSSSLHRKHFQFEKRKWSRTFVATHSDIPGYFLKFFTHKQNDIVDHDKLVRRVKGARVIREYIKANNLEHLFKVPEKWIYPLPVRKSKFASPDCKNFILVVEEMDIHPDKVNAQKWKHSMTRERFEIFYNMIETLGLKDNVYTFNCPFCRDGKQAFIDTEWYHCWPLHYDLLGAYLNEDMKKILHDLCKKKKGKN